jgi:hypothetical protein
MKTKLLGITLLFSSIAFAAPTPLKQDVALKNSQFSQKIYEALEKKITATITVLHMRQISTITIDGLIACRRTITMDLGTGRRATNFDCHLLKDGWRSMGMEVYGSGFKQNLTKSLFDSLSIKATTEEGMKFKTIELEVPDQDGGTERNLLSCTRVGKQAEELGLRDTCEVINGL